MSDTCFNVFVIYTMVLPLVLYGANYYTHLHIIIISVHPLKHETEMESSHL